VQGVGGDLGLLADGLEVPIQLVHRVLQPPDAVDLDRDHVSRLDRARVGRRAG
jgi:hypothetical protein